MSEKTNDTTQARPPAAAAGTEPPPRDRASGADPGPPGGALFGGRLYSQRKELSWQKN